jgi:hypothetical protein
MPDAGSGGFTYLRSGPEREAESRVKESTVWARGGDDDLDEDDYPVDGTIPDIKDWIGDDLDRAQIAYDMEQDRPNPRSTLIGYLEEMLSSPEE